MSSVDGDSDDDNDTSRRSLLVQKYQDCAVGYKVNGWLGRGSEATVFEATKDGHSGLFALKAFRSDTAATDQEATIKMHKWLLQQPVRLQFLAPVTDVVDDQISRGQQIIVMEKAICSLADYMQRSGGKVAACEAKRIFLQLLGAKQELDDHKLIHRDIKPANILFYKVSVRDLVGTTRSTTRAKLGDFGFTRKLRDGDRATSVLGTEEYAAPELFALGKPSYTSSIDIWSLGAVLLHMMFGQWPFQHLCMSSSDTRTWRTQKAIDDQIAIYSRGCADDEKACVAVLRKCLVVNPANRSTLSDLLTAKWFKLTPSPELVSGPDASQLRAVQVLAQIPPASSSSLEAQAATRESEMDAAAGRNGSFSSTDTTTIESPKEVLSSGQDNYASWSADRLESEGRRWLELSRRKREQEQCLHGTQE